MIDKDKLLANPSAPSNTPIVGNFFLKANRKLVSIHSLLKGSVALKKIKLRKQKKEEEDNQRQKTENRLEKRKGGSDKKSLMSSVQAPGGILGWFKNFIGKTLLGFFAVKLLRFLPAIKNILPVVGGAISFLASTGLFLVDSIASFINFSYNVFDGAKGILKSIGGDNLEKTFGNFMGAIDNVINVLILGTLVRGLGGPFAFGRGRGIFGDVAAQAAGIKADGPSKRRRKPAARRQRGRPGISASGVASGTIVGDILQQRKSTSMRDRRILQARAERQKDLKQLQSAQTILKQQKLRETIARKRSEDVLSLKKRIKISGKGKVGQVFINEERSFTAFETKQDRRADLFKSSRARRAAEISFGLDESLKTTTGRVFTNDPDVNIVNNIRQIDDEIERLQSGNKLGRLEPNAAQKINQLNLTRGRLLKKLGVTKQTPLPFLRRARLVFDPRDADYFSQKRKREGFERLQKAIEDPTDDLVPDSKIIKGGAKRSTRRLIIKTLGRNGITAFRGLLKPIPLIGALLDFGVSVGLGDPIPKALAKVAFAGIAGVIGGLGGLAAAPFLGPLAPLAPALGAIIGGVAGDVLAGTLYDITLGKLPVPFFSSQQNDGGNPLAAIMNFLFPTAPASAAEIKESIGAQQNLIPAVPLKDESAQVTPPGKSIFTGEFVLPESVAKDKAFMDGIDRLAEKYQVSPVDILSVMAFETGGSFDPAQKNLAGSGATGLIQFMPDTARGLGTTTQQLAGMTRAQQLKFVDKYFSNKGIQGGSLSDLYMGVLFPAAVGKPDSYILFGNNAAIPRFRGMGPRSAYVQNRGLDLNNDGSITKTEAAAKVEATKKRYAKFGDQSMNRSQGLDTQASYEKAQAPSTVVINKTTLVAMAGEQTTPSVSAPSVVSANPYSTLYAG